MISDDQVSQYAAALPAELPVTLVFEKIAVTAEDASQWAADGSETVEPRAAVAVQYGYRLKLERRLESVDPSLKYDFIVELRVSEGALMDMKGDPAAGMVQYLGESALRDIEYALQSAFSTK